MKLLNQIKVSSLLYASCSWKSQLGRLCAKQSGEANHVMANWQTRQTSKPATNLPVNWQTGKPGY